MPTSLDAACLRCCWWGWGALQRAHEGAGAPSRGTGVDAYVAVLLACSSCYVGQDAQPPFLRRAGWGRAVAGCPASWRRQGFIAFIEPTMNCQRCITFPWVHRPGSTEFRRNPLAENNNRLWRENCCVLAATWDGEKSPWRLSWHRSLGDHEVGVRSSIGAMYAASSDGMLTKRVVGVVKTGGAPVNS